MVAPPDMLSAPDVLGLRTMMERPTTVAVLVNLDETNSSALIFMAAGATIGLVPLPPTMVAAPEPE